MQLEKEAYQALEDIVGTEYITQEPVIGESYNQVWGNKLVFGEKYTRRPAAIVLPSTVEEIQAIVRVCNRYGVLFKAFSSGFEFVATALENDRGILLDLRRMNRILEIDKKNMRAVVEPYVSLYHLHMETAKYGLYSGRPGVGYSAGVIAVTCCHYEMLNSAVYTSGFGRNILGVEWVLPTGELLTLGTHGGARGSFSADGPGFSLRGILRGRAGANGGHGIITKASVKMYPWFGPSEWDMVREPGKPISDAHLGEVPDGYKLFVLTFPTMDDGLNASTEIAHAEISCALSPGFGDTGFAPEGNDEEWEMLQKKRQEQEQASATGYLVTVIINGHSRRELEYREKCLMAITDKYHGYLEPGLNDKEGAARRFQYSVWSTGVPGLRATGDFMVSIDGADGTLAAEKCYHPYEMEARETFVRGGASPYSRLGMTFRPTEHFSIGCSAGIGICYDPWDPSSLEAGKKFKDLIYDPNRKSRSFGYPSRGAMMEAESVEHVHQRWGPLYDNCDYWLRRVKKMLDPNSVADWTSYIPAEYPDEGEQEKTGV